MNADWSVTDPAESETLLGRTFSRVLTQRVLPLTTGDVISAETTRTK